MKTTNTRHDSFRHLLQQIFNVAGKQKRQLKRFFWRALFTAVLRGITFVVFIPLFMAIAKKDVVETVWLLITITTLLLISSLGDWYSRAYDYDGYSAKAGDSLRRLLGQHLRQIPLQALYQQRSGDLNATIAGNVDDVINYSMTVLLMLINAVVIPTVVGLGVMWFDWRLGLALFVLFPSILPIYFLIKPTLTRYQRYQAKANATLSAETLEYAQGLAVLKSAGAAGTKATRFMQAAKEVEKIQLANMKVTAPASILLGSAVEIGVAIVVGFGLWFLSAQTIALPLLVGLVVIVVRFAEPLESFISMMGVYEMIRAGYLRLEKLQNIKPLPQIEPIRVPSDYDICFDRLSFHYDDQGKNVLSNLSLRIPAKALTAMVGTSGCGKTTLVRMLMRYADPQSGRVTIGGIDIRQIEAEQLNQLIATVFQEVYLFDDSIFANVRMGCINASDAKVIEACKAAHCHDFIKRLPNGYQTRVGDIGANLSGGEKQRISIARALLKDAPIIILDEPTAALDSLSEIAVQRAINALVRDKTVIVIAHRLSTIIAAKQIVVMDSGRISEVGGHAELLQKNGRYAQLWRMQSRCFDHALVK